MSEYVPGKGGVVGGKTFTGVSPLKTVMNKLKLNLNALGEYNLNCRVGNRYLKVCKQGEPCKPIEGSFVTECEVKNCKNVK